MGEAAPDEYVVIIALSFCLTFGAYFAVANQLTSILGQQGFYILSIIQGSFLVGTFLGQLVHDALGAQKMFLLGASSFTIFSLAICLTIDTPESRWVLYPVAAYCGLCASWMWCAQGSYVSSLFTSDKQGVGFGKFNSIFSLNGVWGFLLLLVLAAQGVKQATIMWIFFVFSAVASISFFLVKKWPRELLLSIEAGQAGDHKKKVSLCQQCFAVGRMFYNKNMLLQAPLAFWCGNIEGMYWGQIAAEYGMPSIIAACFLTQSIVALGSSVLLGRFADKYGGMKALAVCLLGAAGFNFATGVGIDIKLTTQLNPVNNNTMLNQYEGGTEVGRWCYLLLGAFGFGISDFPAQAIMRAQYHKIWEHDVEKLEAAMPNMLSVLMAGTLTAVLYGGYVHYWVAIGINSCLAIIALICQYFLPSFVNRTGDHVNPNLNAPSVVVTDDVDMEF